MRLTWVHPSWRDLVIESLKEDAAARRHFLSHCGPHGALLALSTEGGADGTREVPLLRDDADWDTFTDHVCRLAAELTDAELTALMLAVGTAWRTTAARDAGALARCLVARTQHLWDAHREPLPLGAIEAWFDLADGDDELPPGVAATWLEMAPAAAPRDTPELERLAEWLRVTAVLKQVRPRLLERLDFPQAYRDALATFLVRARGSDPLTFSAVRLIEALVDELSADALAAWRRLRPERPAEQESGPRPGEARERTANFEVARVLRDL